MSRIDGEGGVSPGRARRAWFAPHRVLVVDDDEDTAVMLRLLLSSMGHTVLAATTGAAAAVCARDLCPELAIIDLQLGDMDGFAVARRLRVEAAGRPIGLIALTGQRVRARCLAAGFHCHVLKPVDATAIDLEMRRASALARSEAMPPAG